MSLRINERWLQVSNTMLTGNLSLLLTDETEARALGKSVRFVDEINDDSVGTVPSELRLLVLDNEQMVDESVGSILLLQR